MVKGRGVQRSQPPQGRAGKGFLTPDNAERILNGIEHNGVSGRGFVVVSGPEEGHRTSEGLGGWNSGQIGRPGQIGWPGRGRVLACTARGGFD